MDSRRELMDLVRVRRTLASGEARRLRESLGLSIAEVAHGYGFWPSAWAGWERAEYSPNSRSARRIALALADLQRLADAAVIEQIQASA